MNLEVEVEKIKPSVKASRKHYQNHPEYYRKYYQERKENWNDYSKKTCECGWRVSCMSSHIKTKKHKLFMELKNKTDCADLINSLINEDSNSIKV